MSRGETLTENLEATLERFKAARDLGFIALNLKKEHDRITDAINRLDLRSIEVPDGWGIWLRPTHPEDPMNTKRLSEDDRQFTIDGWADASPEGIAYQENMGYGPSGVSFMASSIERETGKKIWAYNKEKNFRVEFREGINIEIVDDLRGGD